MEDQLVDGIIKTLARHQSQIHALEDNKKITFQVLSNIIIQSLTHLHDDLTFNKQLENTLSNLTSRITTLENTQHTTTTFVTYLDKERYNLGARISEVGGIACDAHSCINDRYNEILQLQRTQAELTAQIEKLKEDYLGSQGIIAKDIGNIKADLLDQYNKNLKLEEDHSQRLSNLERLHLPPYIEYTDEAKRNHQATIE
jgi:hypothetical protein